MALDGYTDQKMSRQAMKAELLDAETEARLAYAWRDQRDEQALVADRGYDSRAIIDLVRKAGGEAHIPTQSRVKVQRSVDRELYRRRNLVERFFCKLKQFRRIATRFEKHASNFLAAVALASTRIWLRSIESAP